MKFNPPSKEDLLKPLMSLMLKTLALSLIL